jgi:hypothetical protein
VSGAQFHPALVPASFRARPDWVLLSRDRVIGTAMPLPALERAWFNGGAGDADGVGLLIEPGEAIPVELRAAAERAGVRLVPRLNGEDPSNGHGDELPCGGGDPPQPTPQARSPAGATKSGDDDEEDQNDEWGHLEIPTSASVLDIALAIATQLGFPVFPCGANKRPAIPEDKGGHGYLDATTDPGAIRALFAKAGNAARLVGVPTGLRTGVDVVDIDPRHNGDVWERENRHRLPETRIHQTGGGGHHHLLRHHPGVRNSAAMIAPGVDVRGDGGYVIWPPSAGYSVINEVEPADWSPWLLELVLRTEPPPRPFVRTEPGEISDKRLDGLLRSLLDRLSRAPEGAKHDTLLRIARTIGGYAHLLGQGDDQLVRLMLGALPGTVKEWKNAEKTARDGLRNGRASPLELEDRPRPAGTRRSRGNGKYPPPGGIGGRGRPPPPEPPQVPLDDPGPEPEPAPPIGVRLEDFWAHMPSHKYIFAPLGELWPATSVNCRLPKVRVIVADGKRKGFPPAPWLDKHKPVEQMTWAPGLPMIICDRLLRIGGWFQRDGTTCFNLYHPPTIVPGDADLASPWVKHVKLVYPDDAEHIFNWLAHRVQRPAEKINHALVLGGEQGIGKDTLLAPAREAIGAWNFQEASPSQVLGRFNGFLKSVILRVSEARDLGDWDRFAFYDHMKAYTAAPPEVLRVDEKNIPEYAIPNCCGVIITTNHLSDGIHLPPDDRRHYVSWSNLKKEDFPENYWPELWGFYHHHDGLRHVAAWLAERDISQFDPKAPPPKTAAFWAIVDANRAPEVTELADIIDRLSKRDGVDAQGREKLIPPATLTLELLRCAATSDLGDWLADRKNRRTIPHRLESCGYVPIRNPDAGDGLWKLDGKRHAIYARKELSLAKPLAAAREAVDTGRPGQHI